MNAILGLPWMLISAILLTVFILRTISQRREKRLHKRQAAIWDGTRSTIQDWFTGWLANERQQDPESIYNSTSISQYEVERGLKAAKSRFETFLLRETDIKNVGQFIDMIKRQLGRESRDKIDYTGS